jgi:hypothetical protein
MNIIAKLKAMQREIDALRARVEALEPKPLGEPVSYDDAMAQIDAGKASLTDFVWTLPDDSFVSALSKFPSRPAPGVEIIDGPVQVYEAPWPPLAKPIVDAKPIASATIAPPPKKRGRPPKAT